MTTTIIVKVNESGHVEAVTNIPVGYEVKVMFPTAHITFMHQSGREIPPMTEVDSSNLESVGYDKATSTLFIKFHNGNIYSYQDVPADVVGQLVAAESVGSFFNKNIKTNYVYNKEQ